MVDAAQQAAHDGRAGAGDAGDQRRALPAADGEGVQLVQGGEVAASASPAPQPLTEQQQQAVDDQEGGGNDGRAEQPADEFLGEETQDDGGDGGDYDQQEDAAALGDLMRAADADEAGEDGIDQSCQK
jgi:hypothetical protein